jgi:acetyl esterase
MSNGTQEKPRHVKDRDKIDPRAYVVLNMTPHIPVTGPMERAKAIAALKKSSQMTDAVMRQAFGRGPSTVDHGTPYQVTGLDGNQFRVRVFQPLERNAPLPCMVYFHGGGMAMYSMATYHEYYRHLAGLGLVVVGVDYRLSTEAPFPAGLNDCYSSVMWAHEKAKELNIDTNRLIVGGESGGGNLAAATCFLAKKGGVNIIKGQFLNCPYILADTKFASRVNYDKYILARDGMDHVSGPTYTSDKKDRTNPLAWPGNVTVEQLVGMPPALVITAEFDPLVDEGEHYYRLLTQAGVKVVGIRALGLLHAFTVSRVVVPDIFATVHGALYAWIMSINRSKL